MKTKALQSLLMIALLLGVPGIAKAVPLTVDGGWNVFLFGDDFSPWSASFDFTLTDPAVFTVTDRYLSGDQFVVTDFGFGIGVTSIPSSLGDQIGSDWDTAAADPRWSTGLF